MKGQYVIMETGQENRQKRIIVASVFGLFAVVLLLLGLQLFFQKKEMTEIKQQLSEIKSLLLHVETEVKDGRQEEPLQNDSATEQTVPTAVITEVPKISGIQEVEAKHKVYLTFDDGPSKQTDEILDILDQYDVKATFFVVGKGGEEVKERLKKIYERGHTIGMHSYSHDYTQIYESVDAFREDFLQSKQFIFDAIGVESNIYRFPGGSSNTLSKLSMREFVDYLQEQGVEYYDWNISSGDGGGSLMPASVILKNCIESIPRYETSIILLHDSANKTTTVEALPQIIEKIQAMEDTVILPITMNSKPIHHAIKKDENEGIESTSQETIPKENIQE